MTLKFFVCRIPVTLSVSSGHISAQEILICSLKERIVFSGLRQSYLHCKNSSKNRKNVLSQNGRLFDVLICLPFANEILRYLIQEKKQNKTSTSNEIIKRVKSPYILLNSDVGTITLANYTRLFVYRIFVYFFSHLIKQHL